MRDIPQDIREKAEALADAWCQFPQVAGARQAISEALLDMREATAREIIEIIREGHEVPDPSDNCQSTIMEDWEDMELLASAIERRFLQPEASAGEVKR